MKTMAATRRKSAARKQLDEIVGEPLTFGSMLRTTRLTDGYTLASLAEKLGVSRQFVCDVEQGRRRMSGERAARWARKLGYVEAVWVQLALQAAIDSAGLKFRVRVEAA